MQHMPYIEVGLFKRIRYTTRCPKTIQTFPKSTKHTYHMTLKEIIAATRLSENTLSAKIPLNALIAEMNNNENDSSVDVSAEFDHQLIGQERAKEAVAFGLGVSSSGYNMYVMGEQATGRFTLMMKYSLLFLHHMKTQGFNDAKRLLFAISNKNMINLLILSRS